MFDDQVYEALGGLGGVLPPAQMAWIETALAFAKQPGNQAKSSGINRLFDTAREAEIPVSDITTRSLTRQPFANGTTIDAAWYQVDPGHTDPKSLPTLARSVQLRTSDGQVWTYSLDTDGNENLFATTATHDNRAGREALRAADYTTIEPNETSAASRDVSIPNEPTMRRFNELLQEALASGFVEQADPAAGSPPQPDTPQPAN